MFFFFNDTATTEIYTLSLHDALPISECSKKGVSIVAGITVETCTPLTPSAASSWRSTAPRPRTACFDITYGAANGAGTRDTIDPTLINSPDRWARKTGRTARAPWT